MDNRNKSEHQVESELATLMNGPKKVESEYAFRRKIIYKGKMAPSGCVYLVIKFKRKSRVFEACKLIKGGQGEEMEKAICEVIYKQLKDKYKSHFL